MIREVGNNLRTCTALKFLLPMNNVDGSTNFNIIYVWNCLLCNFCRVYPFSEADKLSWEFAFPSYKGYSSYKNYRRLYMKGR